MLNEHPHRLPLSSKEHTVCYYIINWIIAIPFLLFLQHKLSKSRRPRQFQFNDLSQELISLNCFRQVLHEFNESILFLSIYLNEIVLNLWILYLSVLVVV